MDNANPIAKEVRRALAGVRLAPRQAVKDVTFWPLVACGGEGARAAPEPWPLDEALEDGFVGVRALGGGWAEVESRACAPLWVPAGEPLGACGRAAASRIVPPHGRALVWVREEARPCARCAGALVRGLRPPEGCVGFVAAVHDRAVALELVLPGGLLGRRLGRRVAAWAPFLLSSAEPEGFESPEALLAAVRAGEGLGGRARAELLLPGAALTM